MSRNLKYKLTQDILDSPPPLPDNTVKVEWRDSRFPGLYARQGLSEVLTFYYQDKNAEGNSRHSRLGDSIDLTLLEAREAAKKLRARITLGHDPQAELRAQRRTLTWNELFERYLLYVKQHKRSWKNDEEIHRLRISKQFGSLPINRITLAAVSKYHAALKEDGMAPATADHDAKLIRQALNLAVSWGLLKSNPVAGIKLFNADNREERLMSDDELQRLLSSLDTHHRRIPCLVVKWLLYTGARVNEALNARWSDIDRETRNWVIQATNSKSTRRRSVPLNKPALAILDTLSTEGKSEWLFTSSRGDGTARLTTINKAWQDIRCKAQLPRQRLHDLRHMYASMLINSGRTLYEVQQILGHSDPSVTQRYAHLSTKALQEAANSVDRYMEEALKKRN